jgi:hypothetical protein
MGVDLDLCRSIYGINPCHADTMLSSLSAGLLPLSLPCPETAYDVILDACGVAHSMLGEGHGRFKVVASYERGKDGDICYERTSWGPSSWLKLDLAYDEERQVSASMDLYGVAENQSTQYGRSLVIFLTSTLDPHLYLPRYLVRISKK